MKKIISIFLFSTFSAMASVPQTNSDLEWKTYHDKLIQNPKRAVQYAQKALKSEDWFMREAGLKTLMAVDTQKAVQTSLELLKKDNSLLVRSSAVKVLKLLKPKNIEENLWAALDDPRNFRKETSLWIRPQIMVTLIQLGSENKEMFKKYISDKDEKVSKLALSKI